MVKDETAGSEAERMLDDLVTRHRDVLDESRLGMAAKRRRGQLTARERVSRLLDSGATFFESGALAEPVGPAAAAPADSVVVGLGPVHGRPSVVVSYDYTALGGSQGMNSHAKTLRAMGLARQYDAPVYLLVEGGGARATEIGMEAGAQVYGDFGELARLSGRVPIVGLALGRAFAGHGVFLGECDAVIATTSAAMGIAGPPLIRAATGEDLTPEEIGEARIHEAAGAVELLALDDGEAVGLARDYMAYPILPILPYTEVRPHLAEELRALAVVRERRDVREIVSRVADAESVLELRGRWEPSAVTAFARVDGRAVGVIATNQHGGALTGAACDKIARFVGLCSAYGLPLVLMLDSTSFATGEADMFRHAARIPLALREVRVPVVTVALGAVSGAVQAALGMSGRILDGPPLLLWPTAALHPSVGANGSAYALAAAYAVDDVIDPGRTRDLVRGLLSAGRVVPFGQEAPISAW